MAVGEPGRDSVSSAAAGLGPHRANVSIDIIVIGASVAGLACAYTLQLAGHNVLVLEAGSDLGESPGGIRIPPNMSRILLQWGLGPVIEEKTIGRCPKIVFHSGYTGEVFGELVFHKKVMEALAAEVYLLHHADLLEMLYKLAKDAGARFSFGSRVTEVDSEAPTVTLSSGEILRADLIVGGDGYQSVVRSILDCDEKVNKEINYSAYLFSVPTSLFKDDEELLRIIKEPTWNLWMGSGWSVLGHIVRKDTEFALTFFKDEAGSEPQLDWRQRVSVRDLDIEQFKFAPVPYRLMELAGDAVRVRDARTSTLEYWYDNMGHVIVVGEAAHGLNPGSSHGAALAVEDAVVLGRLLSRLKSKDEIKRHLTAFQEIRHQRCENVRSSEQQKVDFVCMPDGPLREARDESMLFQLEQGQSDWTFSEESYLRGAWEEFRDMFGYDAFDDAETWWVEWGVLFDRMNASNETMNEDMFHGQVTVEKALHIT